LVVHTALRPHKVIETVHRVRPELIFLDIGMPRLDGYTLAKMLRVEFGFDSLRLIQQRSRKRLGNSFQHVVLSRRHTAT
jgi:CheY-like chemotaxis protein